VSGRQIRAGTRPASGVTVTAVGLGTVVRLRNTATSMMPVAHRVAGVLAFRRS
jgi:hypothetical protein